MLSAIGLIIAIALLIVMIVKGVDMITASVVTAAIILVTSGLDFWEGLLKTFSEGAGSFCSSWFLILALGGILVNWSIRQGWLPRSQNLYLLHLEPKEWG